MSPLVLAGLFAALAASAGLACWLMTLRLRPFLADIAAAKPDARSTHRVPTPQGAGLAVMAAALASALAGTLAFGGPDAAFGWLAGGLVILTALGLVDDMIGMAWLPKLAIQALACVLALLGLPEAFQIFGISGLFWVERAGLLLSLLAIVNFVNFIDGIDEITAAHATPGIAACMLAALAAEIDGRTGLFAASLFGALIGFWLWNRHPARIFLGDAGSLPLGLALGWLGLVLAQRSPVAGILILVYPLTDATWTLARRLFRGDRITTPHREHAYQAATDTGLTHRRIIVTVAVISSLGAVLALACLTLPAVWVQAGSLAVAALATWVPLQTWLKRRANAS
ncbi:glycosyl transferase [Phreatobacter aquaticus]|uniref:Glycosyl transferase n=1 Tax=Phreatobacter aquaticus TaxID=2570229 RepID=A0A4D7QKP0_9HYPH|nr:glycosyl transferase [Phreatobacter aquaticus]QCK88188.1 glycosyl transferase [Phreatobacter aquaticus]